MKWQFDMNGFGSIESWYIVEPLGTFISIFPLVGSNGVMYQVNGPQMSHYQSYSTLSRAKEVGEALCRFQEENEWELVPIEIPSDSGVKIRTLDGRQETHAQTFKGKRFTPPPH